jgi:drug/metabolite transporter (DMT)-like permease
MPRPSDLKYDLALLGTVLVWGINFAVVKAVLVVMSPHAMNLFRLSVSAVALGILYVMQQRKSGEPFWAPVQQFGGRLFALGLLGFLFYQLCFIIGVDHTTAGSAALIMASSPLWTALLGHVFGFDKVPRAAWIGLFTTLVGAVVIVLGSSKAIDFSNDAFLGNMLMMLAALLWGAYTAFSKPVSRDATPVSISFLGLLFALPFLIALGLPTLDEVAWDQVNYWVWIAIFFSGGLSTGLAVAVWNTAIKEVGPSQTAVYGNLVPGIALISGYLLRGETVTWVQGGGGVLILGGLLLMRRSRQPRVAIVGC